MSTFYTSFDSCLSPISEEENTILVPDRGSPPPKRPINQTDFTEKANYIQDSVTWLHHEIFKMKKLDRDLMASFQHMLKTVKSLKQMNKCFEEQTNFRYNLENEEISHALVDLPATNNNFKWDNNASVEIQRYKRIGNLERHCSYS